MGEEDGGARREVRLDVVGVDLRLHLVGQEHRDELRARDGIGNGTYRQSCRLCLAPRGRSLAQADLDLDAGITEVERMGVALAPVADDRNLAVEKAEVAVAENRCHFLFVPSLMSNDASG